MFQATTLYAITVFIVTVNAVNTVECGNYSLSINDHTNMTYSLWQSCLLDDTCKDLYDQDTPNITVFTYLTKQLIQSTAYLESPLFDEICNMTTEEANLNLWLWILKSKIHERQICDINYKLVVSRDTLSSKCVCKSDKSCKSESDHLHTLYAILSLAIVMMVLLIALNLYNIFAPKLKTQTKSKLFKKLL